MIYAIANEFFYDSLRTQVPKQVDTVVRQTLRIYAKSYDMSIPFQSGGYVIVVTNKAEYQATLDQLNITSDIAEYSEIVSETEDGVWEQEYFQLATEYGITIFFYEPKGVNA